MACLKELIRCFHGVIPTLFATADAGGVPNITYISHVHYIDERHVGVSRQFFNKTSRNLDVNPRACAEVIDPATMQAYRLHLRLIRSETTGELFDTMSMRIQAIASQTGMAGVFRLIAADVFEVERLEKVEGFLSEPAVHVAQDELSLDGVRTELKGVQFVSERINRAENLEGLLDAALEALDAYFNFRHTMVLLYEPACDRLVTIASHGYGESGVGAEVGMGEGLIGTVGRERRVLRLTGLDASLRYGRAVRREAQKSGNRVAPEIPLPGLPDAQSTLLIPLSLGDRLVGVLVAESHNAMRFDDWDEAYLEVIGNQIALSIDRMVERDEADAPPVASPMLRVSEPPKSEEAAPMRTVVYYRNDECIFVDDEYLIRNVPAKILWRLLSEWRSRGRTEFTNRELRLDQSLGLPEFKDNLESRLILLRKRLEEKCPDVRIVSTGRGRFALSVDSNLGLVER